MQVEKACKWQWDKSGKGHAYDPKIHWQKFLFSLEQNNYLQIFLIHQRV